MMSMNLKVIFCKGKRYVKFSITVMNNIITIIMHVNIIFFK